MPDDFSQIDRAAVEDMGARLEPHVRRSPVADYEDLSRRAGAVLVKQEFRSPGSWLFRAALARAIELIASQECAALEEVELVVAARGDLGTAVARAAAVLGCRASVFLSGWYTATALRSLGARVVERRGSAADSALAARRYCAVPQPGASHLIEIDRWTAVTAAATVAREFEEQAGATPSRGQPRSLGEAAGHSPSPLDRVLVSAIDPVLVAGALAWFGGRAEVVSVACEGDLLAAPAGGPEALVVSYEDESDAREWFRDRYGSGDRRAALPLAAVLSGRCPPEPAERMGLILDPPKIDPVLGFVH